MANPVVVHSVSEVRSHLLTAKSAGKIVGVVPTMGALHRGHISLLQAACAECDFVIATIFVNPTQFAPNEDLERYPRPAEADFSICRKEKIDLVFMPTLQEMYPVGFSSFVEVGGISSTLEGEHRPSHFRGVTTVVLKLFNITSPDAAFFGQKDYQQQLLIRQMCIDLNLPIKIVTCPTVREPDGLALSSRNQYLSKTERQAALSLSQALQQAETLLQNGETDISLVTQAMQKTVISTTGVNVDYATIRHPDTLEELQQPQLKMVALIAAQVGNIRLIDNRVIIVKNLHATH